MSKQDLHYLRSILGNLREFRTVCDGEGSMLGHEVLADNIDWLDCFIERVAKAKEKADAVRS